jgi:hypothetical protein
MLRRRCAHAASTRNKDSNFFEALLFAHTAQLGAKRRFHFYSAAMVIRIASAVLTLAGLLALISGGLFWIGLALNLMSLHMLLGFVAVAALWTIGVAQAIAHRGSWVIALCAVLVGALTIALGFYQSSLMVGPLHWVVEITHLILGILTIGLGHMGAARYRKASAT